MKKLIVLVCSLLLASSIFAQNKNNQKVTLNPAGQKDLFAQKVTVTPMDKTVTITKNKIILSAKTEEQTYTISGYFCGQIINKTKNTTIKLNNAYIENKSGEPAIFCEAKTEISTAKVSNNFVVSSGKIDEKNAAIQGKKDIVLGGSGTLTVVGSVYHGIKADDVKIKGSGTFYFQGTSKGACLNCTSLVVENDKTFNAYFVNSKNGIKADNTILIKSGNLNFYNNGTALKTDTTKESPKAPHSIKLEGGTICLFANDELYYTQKNAFTNNAKLVEQ